MPIPFSDAQRLALQNLLSRSSLALSNTQGNDNTLQGNEGNERLNSGIFGDLFNILRRPAAASAGAALALTGKSPDTTNPLLSAWQGLSGQTNHNYSEVLGALGVKNNIARSVGGFIGDVALDPLTYLGAEGEKGIGSTEATSQAVRDLSTNAPDILASNFGDAVAQKSADLQAQNPSHVWATFFGKKIPGTDNTILPTIGNKIKDIVAGPEDNRRLLARMFSADSEQPFGLADSARVYDGGSAGAFMGHQAAIDDAFKGLTPDERTNIALAINRGDDLSSVPLDMTQKHPAGFTTLGDYQNLAKSQMDKWFADEAKIGLRDPNAYDPNYVYKYYQNPPPDIVPGAVGIKGRLGNTPDFSHLTLDDAMASGLDPVTDIADILKLRAASHYRNMGRAAFVDDALNKFGVTATDQNLPYLAGMSGNKQLDWVPVEKSLDSPLVASGNYDKMWLPRPVAEALNKTVGTFSDASTGSEFMRWYDNIMSNWKLFNTGMSPGYHIRNSLSDAIMNFADGVRNPLEYQQAAKVLADVRDNNMANFLNVPKTLTTDVETGAPVAVPGAENPVSAASSGYVKIGNQNVPTADAWNLYLKSGSKSGQIFADVNSQLDPTANQAIGQYLAKGKQVAGNALGEFRDKVSDISNLREDFFRMSHFLSAMKDELPAAGGDLEKAAMAAGERVRKYNIDYGKLSTFEKNYVKKVVPFYTWMRKNIPLQAQMLFTKPGFMALYPKGQDLLQGVLGADDGSGDFLIPKWIRDSAPVRLALGKQDGGNKLQSIIRSLAGAKAGQAVFAPLISTVTPLGELSKIGEPVNAALDQGPVAGLRNLVGQGVNMTTPFIKAPVEATTGQNLYSGAKIKDWGSWLAGQIAPSRVLDAVATGDPASRNRALSSFLTGFAPQAVTDPRMAAEFKRRSDVINAYDTAIKNNILYQRGINPNTVQGQVLKNKVKTPETAALQKWQQLVTNHFFGRKAMLYQQAQQQGGV